MSHLFILNDPPYGTERSYNGLRLATRLARERGASVRVFLMGDAVSCAKAGQKVPGGYYNVEAMLHGLGKLGADIGVCGTCIDARGIREAELVEGTHRSSMEELTAWTLEAERAITF